MLTADEDATLNARVCEGDRAAFQVLVLRHEARLRAFIGRIAGPTLGDDLAQEAFLKAWLRAGEYRSEGSYRAWLTGICWRLFLDHQRREKRRAQMMGRELPPESAVGASGVEAGMDVERLLAMLQPAERAALILCDGHGWSHGKAAAILGVPLGSLKSTVLRAKQKLLNRVSEGQDL